MSPTQSPTYIQYNRTRPLSLLFFPLLLLFVLQNPLFAQRMNATVVAHIDQLSLEEQLYLKGIGATLTTLINSYPWTDGKSQTPFPLSVDIFYNTEADANIYKKYSAGIMVALPSGIQLRDSRWDFRYSSVDKPHFGEPYDSFTGMIEFFIWICYGFEVDRLAPLGGGAFYERARLIAERSTFDAAYYKGWDDRRTFIRDLVQDSTFIKLRLAAFYVNAGTWYADRGSDQAGQYLEKAADYIMQCKPEQLEMKRDDNIIRWVNLDDFTAALKKTGETALLDAVEEWKSSGSE